MKPAKILLLSVWGLGFSVFILSIGCTDQSQSTVCSDPIGSQNITINNSVVDYNNCFFCFKPELITGADTCLYNYCFQLYYSSSTQLIKSIYFNNCSYGMIADMGQVSCLGAVTAKPANGFVYTVAPMLNHGYVVSFPDGSYGRFFIDSWTMVSGEITVMNIVRQYPF
jgi:hypothetical protein